MNDTITCGVCKYWKMGIPTGRCQHPAAGLLYTSDRMVFEDASKECPKHKDEDTDAVLAVPLIPREEFEKMFKEYLKRNNLD